MPRIVANISQVGLGRDGPSGGIPVHCWGCCSKISIHQKYHDSGRRRRIEAAADQMFEQLMRRVDGLGNREYLWEPTPDAWSVRPTVNGAPAVDGAGIRDIDPPPVTTIAWRTWHIAIDCFDDYRRRFGGDESDAPSEWTLDASEAIQVIRTKWQEYRSHVVDLDWWQELGESWGPWSRHCVADMVMHASNELVHHGAEIGLLRDLYRSRDAGGSGH